MNPRRPARRLALATTLVALSLASGCGKPEHAVTWVYPFEGSVFPRDIAPPTVRWTDDKSGATGWRLRLLFDAVDGRPPAEAIEVETRETQWRPDGALWERIKAGSLDRKAALTVEGFERVLGVRRPRSVATLTFQTSPDPVGAPVFFRLVPLPFTHALKHMEQIKWVLGDVASPEPPKVVLENLPMCGNCHSFSADGRIMGMDVDYANDKGSYVVAKVAPEVVIDKDKVITWADYKRDDGEDTLGLLSHVSPSGRYVVSTVKDTSLFAAQENLAYSQLFFPLKGILVVYDTVEKTFAALPGADDKRYVQSNPSWSPDEQYVIFARAPAEELERVKVGKQVFATKEQAEAFTSRSRRFRFDLYRVPFAGGKGGVAEPLPGASNNGRSNYFARTSPDGKWLVFCQSDSFMLLQPDSALYIMPAAGGTPRKMTCNTASMNSWHSWSPNGRWLAFATKHFSPYTQVFLTHIDAEGRDSPPVLAWDFSDARLAANIPEFANLQPGELNRLQERYVEDYSYVRKGSFFNHVFPDDDVAIESFEKAVALNPDNALAHFRLGHHRLKHGDPVAARRHFERLMKIAGDAVRRLDVAAWSDKQRTALVEAHGCLGLLAATERKAAEAIAEFQAVLALDPRNHKAHLSLALVHDQTGRPDLTLLHLEKALEIRPDDAATRQKVDQLRAVLGRRAP